MESPARDLAAAAYDVADEYRDGRLKHLRGRAWRDTWQQLVEELSRRCPGHRDEEYRAALERGFVESR